MASRNPNWPIMQHQTNINSNSPLFSLLHHQLSLHGDGHGGSPNHSSSSSSSSTSSIPFNPLLDEQPPHQEPWSQILMSGAQEGSLELNTHLQGMNPPSLDHPKANHNNENMLFGHGENDAHHHHHEHQFIKQEVYGHGGHEHGHGHGNDMDYHDEMASTWPHMVVLPSPKSCTTTLSSNNDNNINSFMDFSSNTSKGRLHAQPSFESNSYATAGGAPKKPRVQSSSIPPLKVRKEKLGDRITALHQLVSPFGKTDTASVLIETIGCIRFLQAQIEVLSSPYLGSPPSKSHHFVESLKELRSKGLCVVPTTSLTHIIGTDNNNSAAEYWAPSLAVGF